MAYTPVTVMLLRMLRRKQGRQLHENAADIGIHCDREWVNHCCAYDCDCGECYSRHPDQEDSHHCEDKQ